MTSANIVLTKKQDLNPIFRLDPNENYQSHLLKKTFWKTVAIVTIVAAAALAIAMLYLSSQSLFVWDLSKTTFAVLMSSPFAILFFNTFIDWSFFNEDQSEKEKQVLTRINQIQDKHLSYHDLKQLFQEKGVDLEKISYVPLFCLNRSEPLRALVPLFARYCHFISNVEESQKKIDEIEDIQNSREKIWALSEEILKEKIKAAYMLYLMENPDSQKGILHFGKTTPQSLSQRLKKGNFNFYSFSLSKKPPLTAEELDGMSLHQIKDTIFYQ